MDLGEWYSSTASELCSQLWHSPAVVEALGAHRYDRAVHLAVMVEPFLSFVLDGSKSIESRFSSVKVPPFQSVESGDVVLLKQAAGPIVAATLALDVWSFNCLTPRVREDLRARFGRDLRDDVDDFWGQREAMSYATLIRLGPVAYLDDPLDCPKSDRRGWVVLRERSRQMGLFT